MDDLVEMSLEALARHFEAEARAAGYAQDPVAWITDILEAFLWSAQREVLESVVKHRYTAVKAGHGVGKSYLAAALTAWWLLNHRRGHTRVVTTAPTAAQVEHVIWMEIKRVHRILVEKDLHDGSKITAGNQPAWKTRGGQDTIAIGRKPADHDDNGFQGFHDVFLLVIIDEACGVPKNLFDGVDSVATGKENRIVAFGNPTDRSSHFFTVCSKLKDWHVIRIDLLRSPNMTAEACEKYPELKAAMKEAGIRPSTEYVPPHVAESISSAAFVAEKVRMWGTKSALWISKVRGEFPDDSNEGVIPLAWIEAAQRRWIEWDEAGRPAQPGIPIISCDVAGAGEDATCIGYRVGNLYVGHKVFIGEDDPVKITKRLLRAQGPTTLQMPGLEYIIDATGEGKGVYSNMAEHMFNLNLPIVPSVHAFIAAKGAGRLTDDGMFGFKNMRSWSWWNLRMLLTPHQRGGSRIMLPDIPELTADLQAPKHKYTDKGNPPVIQVESKDTIRQRLGRSTDMGDACVMAFALSGRPKPQPTDEEAIHTWGGREQRPDRPDINMDPMGLEGGQSFFDMGDGGYVSFSEGI